MCGRYTLSQGEKVIEAIPNITIREDLRKLADRARFNIAPTQDILVAVQTGAAPELQLMQWGLIPSWAKDSSIANKLINARAETIAQKPAFRQAFRQRRCAIPADGFYEWRQNSDGTKTPLYIRLKTHAGFALAGLWETWRDPTGETVTTCTIITTPPNALLAPIHNRMPAILSPDAVRQWLGPHPCPPEELLAHLQPFPAEQMEFHAVSRSVNSVTHDGPELVHPVAEATLHQDSHRPVSSRSRHTQSDDSTQPTLF
jgi:putative SOS response-associated peptidase YedK